MTRGDKGGAAESGRPGEGARRVSSVRGSKGDAAKEARVKAALKANIARRKAQARARDESGDKDE